MPGGSGKRPKGAFAEIAIQLSGKFLRRIWKNSFQSLKSKKWRGIAAFAGALAETTSELAGGAPGAGVS